MLLNQAFRAENGIDRHIGIGPFLYANSGDVFYLCHMLPDYPHKLFSDQRCHFSLLMEALAMDVPTP